MSAVVVTEVTGSICEPCYALNSGIDESYWESDPEGREHAERHALEWAQQGFMVLDTGEEPEAHFGHSCIVCGTLRYSGNVYDGTLTVFER